MTTRTPNAGDAGSAEKLAKDDIAGVAKGAYGENAVGTRIHGGVTSHKQIAAASVSVAGDTGYQVRWRVVTGKGPGGYVQSLVVVRHAFDAGPDGHPLSLMDTLTKGIRPIGDSETSGRRRQLGRPLTPAAGPLRGRCGPRPGTSAPPPSPGPPR